MKKTDLAEIKKMDFKTVAGRAQKLQTELTAKVLDKSVNKLSNLREVKNIRRDLAQVLTVLRQKELLNKLEEENAGK